MKDEKQHIPPQEKGAKTDVTASVSFQTSEEAKQHFLKAKKRLMSVFEWHRYAGEGSAVFELMDRNKQKIFRPAEEGDYFRIDIPAPGSKTGEGKDWVQIELVDGNNDEDEAKEYAAIKVRPVSNPMNNDIETAHFFKEDATSTFIVKRELNTVTAEVHGRNELPNTKNTGLIDTVRNALIATGAWLGFSSVQWSKLVHGLVSIEADE